MISSAREGVFVTLENWAVNDVSAANKNWGWCVYGSLAPGITEEALKRETYHTALTKSGGYGNISLTMICTLPLRKVKNSGDSSNKVLPM